jgi:hypothetical protein
LFAPPQDTSAGLGLDFAGGDVIYLGARNTMRGWKYLFFSIGKNYCFPAPKGYPQTRTTHLPPFSALIPHFVIYLSFRCGKTGYVCGYKNRTANITNTAQTSHRFP